MKLLNNILTGLAGIAVIGILPSCEQEFYKDEQYRKEVYLVSGDNNIFGQEYNFGGDEGNLSIYVGGTKSVEHDISIELARDANAIGDYNKRTYDQSFSSYALELPEERYTIENTTLIMTSNSETPYVKCPIQVNTDGLSPDETYFIPLKIESVSDYMASQSKNYVLFQVYMINKYATTKSNTYYTMNGTSRTGSMQDGKYTSNQNPQVINSSKLVKPLGAETIRILPAARQSTALNNIREWGIAATVHPDEIINVPVLEEGQETGEFIPMHKVTLAPYTEGHNSVQLQEIEDSPSTYDPETKTFYLYYRYKISSDNNWYEMKETMVNNRS